MTNLISISACKTFLDQRILRQTEEFQADDVYGGGGNDEYRTSFTEREARTIKKSKTEKFTKGTEPVD
ncbi:hypothetical protein F8388_020672 [Cannabis sativa]|uniref:Uncharacterized protein n=1 Tax=Cannabis sativa TaxID=3483 RepID=A0A7J6F2V2_CANSA|nr:hypothetical protein F8388_018255 [Cannabis sativa]KAF4358393.1 hypothetical protein F8388_018257 [Cannabis sativa]KAF4358395.1 hypothetical protein F8388_018259 [Cannabis sativa]KAF4358397.1 hypothetical protein F8388_018261 [Cannabis sativa]KAF4364954.1 hypothetical protein F8388_020668 [Cannabis sativa]